MRSDPKYPVMATVHFGLTQCTLQVDVAEGLHVLSASAVRSILQEDGEVHDSHAANRILRAVKSNPELQERYADYACKYADLNSQLLDHRGYGLDGDEEPEVTLELGELVVWAYRFKPHAIPKD